MEVYFSSETKTFELKMNDKTRHCEFLSLISKLWSSERNFKEYSPSSFDKFVQNFKFQNMGVKQLYVQIILREFGQAERA